MDKCGRLGGRSESLLLVEICCAHGGACAGALRTNMRETDAATDTPFWARKGTVNPDDRQPARSMTRLFLQAVIIKSGNYCQIDCLCGCLIDSKYCRLGSKVVV